MSNQNGGSQQAAIQQLQLENQELRNTIGKIQEDQHIIFQNMLALVNSLNANNNKKNVQETPKEEPNKPTPKMTQDLDQLINLMQQQPAPETMPLNMPAGNEFQVPQVGQKQPAPEKQNLFPPFEIDNMGKPSQSAPETMPLNMPAGNEFQVPQVGQKQSTPKMPQGLDKPSNLMQQQPENKPGIDEEIEGLDDFLSLEGDVQKQTQPQPEEKKQENEVKHDEVSAKKPQPETKPVNECKSGFGNLITRLFSSNRELKNNQKVLGTTSINKQQNGLAQQ